MLTRLVADSVNVPANTWSMPGSPITYAIALASCALQCYITFLCRFLFQFCWWIHFVQIPHGPLEQKSSKTCYNLQTPSPFFEPLDRLDPWFFFHWFQPFPTHRNPRARRTGVPPHPSLHPEAWWVSHFGMGGKFELPVLPFCDSSYSCNWKLDSFGADLMWLMCAFSQYVSLGSLDTLNTGKLILRRASLGCFSSVEVWRVEHVTALPANRATQSASRGWETIRFSEIGYMHIYI